MACDNKTHVWSWGVSYPWSRRQRATFSERKYLRWPDESKATGNDDLDKNTTRLDGQYDDNQLTG